MGKIAIYGGTFNPVHNGHIEVVKQVKKQLGCDKIIVVPTHEPPHKTVRDLASNEHRLEMCRIAFESENVEVSDFEIANGGESYTYITLEHFRRIYPNDGLYFVMGSDMLFSFLNWKNPNIIMSLATLVCICRTNDDLLTVDKHINEIENNGGKCIALECAPVPMSSTLIRACIAAEKSIESFTSKEIAEYIVKNNLYNFDKSGYTEYYKYLEENLSTKRYIHSCNVANTALELAILNRCDPHKAFMAGLLHDACKEMTYEEQYAYMAASEFEVSKVESIAQKTWHGIAASSFVKEKFGINDGYVLSAIRYHTVGKANMTDLEKIIYLADLISADRNYPDLDEMRKYTYQDLSLGMYKAMCYSINNSVERGRTIPHLTLEAYNEYTEYYIQKCKQK